MAITLYKFDPKPATGSDLFFFDWTEWAQAMPGEAIDISSIAVTASPPTITVSEVALNGCVVRCRLTGGVQNITYTVTCTVVSTPGRRRDSADATIYITR